MWRVAALCFLAVLSADARARADNQEDALHLLDEGVALFQANDLAAAREAFARARDLVPDKANPYRWLGLVDARLGHCQDAIDELETFLKRVPVTDTRAIEAITVRDRCRAELQPKVGTLIVDSTPSGVEVRIDDPDKPALGTTPFRAELPVGSHLVYLRGRELQPAVKSITVGRNETMRIDVTLQAAPVVAPVAPPVEKKRSKLWIVGVAVGAAAAAALAVGLGVGLAGGHSPDTVLMPVRAQ